MFIKNASKYIIAHRGEHEVCNYLKQNGFIILAQNFQVRNGEVDIIAQKKNLLSFIEVKTRSSHYFPLSQVITYAKQMRIIKAAFHFLQKNTLNSDDFILRFDVALVHTDSHASKINFIENAFTCTNRF